MCRLLVSCPRRPYAGTWRALAVPESTHHTPINNSHVKTDITQTPHQSAQNAVLLQNARKTVFANAFLFFSSGWVCARGIASSAPSKKWHQSRFLSWWVCHIPRITEQTEQIGQSDTSICKDLIQIALLRTGFLTGLCWNQLYQFSHQ